jgi:hypothetical protein
MTTLIAVLAGLVAAAAAARSTWSPCGLSMLSTITPVSERAKGNSYRSTASWFVVGAVAGGATLGAVMAALAAGVRSFHLSAGALGVSALAAALVAAVSDSGGAGLRVPIHRRQVNERWLDQYRSWVYGAGFGWQIGTGLMTYITTAAVYLMVVLGALSTSPVVALAIGCGFGLCRGLAVFLTARITNPTALRAFHRRFTEVGPTVGRIVTSTEFLVAAVLAVALVGTLGPWPAPVIVVGVLAVSAVCRALTRTPHPEPAPAGDEMGPVPVRPDSSPAARSASGPVARPVPSASR